MADTADFNAVLDHANLGKEPSEHYLERLNALDNIVRECIHISRGHAGIPSPTGRHFYASVLFTTMITKAVSLISLAPYSKWAAKVIEHWDYASAAGIARTMLEARLAFYYLCTDPCSEEEWQCRWNLFNLHDCTARKRLFDALGEVEQVEGFETQAEELRERLRSNPFFQTLPDGQQRKFLNGQSAYLMSLEDIAERAALAKGRFRWLYVLLSSHVHSLPMSFYRIGGGEEERGRGLPSPVEENYTSLCLSLAMTILTATRDEVHAMFAGIAKQTASISEEMPEETIVEALAQPDKFAIGETVELFKNKEIRLEVKRLGKEEIEAVYYHEPSNVVVLRRIVSGDGMYLHDLDPLFWTIQVNGKAASEGTITLLEKGPYAFKVDHTNRTLSFKTEQ